MNLAQSIEAAQANNEKRLASQVPALKLELDSEALLLLRHFAEWARARGVKFCPAAPASVAAFVRSEAAAGVPPERILSAVRAIEAMHNNEGLANPVATGICRAELQRILKTEPPASWNKQEQLLWLDLPPEIQAVISQRDAQGRASVHRKLNEI